MIPPIDPDEPVDMQNLELGLTQQVTGQRPAVRNNCAFCGRERTARDDNHGPDCFYWDLPDLHGGA